jgi:hypothetical protein
MAALISTRPYRRGAPPSLPDEGRYVASEFKKIEAAFSSLNSDVVTPQRFGAKGNMAQDDAGPFQDAADYCKARGRALWIPSVDVGYHITRPINITGGMSVFGEHSPGNNWGIGKGSVLRPVSGITTFKVATDEAVNFSGFSIIYPGAVPATTGNYGIELNGSTSINDRATIDNVRVINADRGINTVSAANWSITRCLLQSCNIGLYVDDAYHADAGDSSFENNIVNMVSGVSNIYGVFQAASGGLRIVNNKFNGGYVHYRMNLTAGAQTGDLFFSANSCEGAAATSVLLSRLDGTAKFQVINITGNEFTNTGPDSRVIYAPDTGSDYWLTLLTICSNLFISGAGGTVNDIIVLQNAQGGVIANNVIRSIDPICRKLVLTATVDSFTVGPNQGIGPFSANNIGGATNLTTISPT